MVRSMRWAELPGRGGAGALRLGAGPRRGPAHVGERELDQRAGDVARLLEDAVLLVEGAKQLALPA